MAEKLIRISKMKSAQLVNELVAVAPLEVLHLAKEFSSDTPIFARFFIEGYLAKHASCNEGFPEQILGKNYGDGIPEHVFGILTNDPNKLVEDFCEHASFDCKRFIFTRTSNHSEALLGFCLGHEVCRKVENNVLEKILGE